MHSVYSQFVCENNLETWAFVLFWQSPRKQSVHRLHAMGIYMVLITAPQNFFCHRDTNFWETRLHIMSLKESLRSFLFTRNISVCSSFLPIWSHSLLLALRHFSHLLIQMAHSCELQRVVFQTFSVPSLLKSHDSWVAEAGSVLGMLRKKEELWKKNTAFLHKLFRREKTYSLMADAKMPALQPKDQR